LYSPKQVRFRIRPWRLSSLPTTIEKSNTPHWIAWIVLLIISGAFFFYGLNAGELYRTESLRAIIAAEFLRTGDWIVPCLYGEPLFTKPPGSYAAIALASWPFGKVTEWSARLPAALAASILVGLFYSLFSRNLGRVAGFIAAATVPLSMMILDKATSAEIDMLQVTWVAAAICCFVRAIESTELPVTPSSCHPVVLWWLGAFLCVAGGFLTKWTAPAFFYCTVIPLLLWRGQLRILWSAPHLVALTVAAGACGLWVAAAISLEGWDSFSSTVKRQAFMHLSSTHQQRPYPWSDALVHPFRMFGAALPISLFALPALTPRFMRLWDYRGRFLLQLFHCWLWPNLLFWTLVPAHNARHSFPLYPAIVGFAAMTWTAWFTGKLVWRFARISPRTALIGMVAGWWIVKLGFVHYIVPDRLEGREPRAKGELVRALVPDGETLYLCRLKDEGIMFYYGRPVRRLPGVVHLPPTREPLYCILEDAEWRDAKIPHVVLAEFHDQQGAPIVLVRFSAIGDQESIADLSDAVTD
jgi:4-amino-4-deoxy-L-arabinose transferase-like glycosyltransferase